MKNAYSHSVYLILRARNTLPPHLPLPAVLARSILLLISDKFSSSFLYPQPSPPITLGILLSFLFFFFLRSFFTLTQGGPKLFVTIIFIIHSVNPLFMLFIECTPVYLFQRPHHHYHHAHAHTHTHAQPRTHTHTHTHIHTPSPLADFMHCSYFIRHNRLIFRQSLSLLFS